MSGTWVSASPEVIGHSMFTVGLNIYSLIVILGYGCIRNYYGTVQEFKDSLDKSRLKGVLLLLFVGLVNSYSLRWI